MHEDNTRINTGAQSMLINVHAVKKIFHTDLCFYSCLPWYGVDLLEEVVELIGSVSQWFLNNCSRRSKLYCFLSCMN